MVKYLKLIFVIVLIFVAIFLYWTIKQQEAQEPETIEYTLQGKKLKLLVADNDEERTQGLMHYRSLPYQIDGMIFTFPSKSMQSFWNKNTFMDLDVYWLIDDEVVGKDELPSIEKSKDLVYITSPRPVDTVIEVVK